MIITLLRILIVVGILLSGLPDPVKAEERSTTDQEKRIEELARSIEALSKQLQALKEERNAEKAAMAAKEESVTRLATQVDKMSSSKVLIPPPGE